MERILQAEA